MRAEEASRALVPALDAPRKVPMDPRRHSPAAARNAAPILAQLTSELLISIGQGDETDPLVQIRQQELGLRAAEIESDNAQFEAKQEQRFAEKLLENELAKERLSAQKEIADDKLDVARQRLSQQAELKLLDMQNRGSS